jgi:hypothetical protein
MKVLFLFPYIILVWLAAKQDPHLFRYWDVHSLRHWQQTKFDWKAWAIAGIGWLVIGCSVGAIYLVARRWT